MQTFQLSYFCERHGIELNKFNETLDRIIKPSKEGPWIAGGCIRRLVSNEKPFESDIDFFFANEEQLVSFRNSLLGLKAEVTKESEFNIEYKLCLDNKIYKIQAIKIKFYSNIEEVLNSFDFTICQFAFDGSTLYCGEYSLWDLSRKRLVINKVTYGVSTVRRLLKYTKQGYYACAGCLSSVLESVARDPSSIQSKVEYVD